MGQYWEMGLLVCDTNPLYLLLATLWVLLSTWRGKEIDPRIKSWVRKLALDYFLIIWAMTSIRQHWSFLSGYIISSYYFYFAPDYLKDHDQQQSTTLLRTIAIIQPLKCPQNSTHHKSHKLSAAGKIMPVLESETNQSWQWKMWGSPHILYLGLKQIHISVSISVFCFFLRNQISKFSQHLPVSVLRN